jgi:hypothetical protein
MLSLGYVLFCHVVVGSGLSARAGFVVAELLLCVVVSF